MDKHAAIHTWVSECPLLSDIPKFDFLSENQGAVAISPAATDRFVRSYIDGSGIKQYQFQLQAMLFESDTDDSTNTDNMQLLDTWRDWLHEQNKAKNFPDFGADCSGYRVISLDNMPILSMRYESGYTKYTISTTIQYFERTQERM